ncbi:hypothetical protein ACGFI9_37315 [Micromonospora sp. NPDC048930]|uniref:hypothetical protein n=1 Tax=Micromonospora sp. NPDC048930 TaxID=3364261 RepID=UPI0037178B0A
MPADHVSPDAQATIDAVLAANPGILQPRDPNRPEPHWRDMQHEMQEDSIFPYDEIDQQRARAEAAEQELTEARAELERLAEDRHKLARLDEIRATYDQAREGLAKYRDELTAHHAELHTKLNATENDLRSANRAVQEFAAQAERNRHTIAALVAAAPAADHAHRQLRAIREARAHRCDTHCTEGGCDFDLAAFVDRVDEILNDQDDAPPSGLGSPRRAQEDPATARRRHALAFNALSRVLAERREFVRLSTRKRCAEAVLAALDADRQEIRGEHGPEIPAEQLPVSSVIAVSNKFARAADSQPRYARAAGHPAGGDWVRLRTGSGRTYEGYRAAACPGDGVAGHQHDIRCVNEPS